MTKLALTLTIIVLFSATGSFSQNSNNYSVAYTMDGFLSRTADGDIITWNGADAVNLFPLNISGTSISDVKKGIAFPFCMMGKFYDSIHIGVNGCVGLSLSKPTAAIDQTSFFTSLSREIQYPPISAYSTATIAAFGDFLKTSNTGATVRMTTTGVRGRRCIIIEWQVRISFASTTSGPNGIFQLRLYEKTGVIEMVYGKMEIGINSTFVNASIGVGSGNTSNSGIYVNNLAPFTVDRTTDNSQLVNSRTAGPISALTSNTEGQRKRILFTPIVLTGNFLTSSVSGIGPKEMTLNWSDNFTNESGYVLMTGDSVNGSNYYQWYPANTTSALVSGLLPNTRYRFRLLAFTEGNITKELAFTDSTRCRYNGTYSVGAGGDFITLKAAGDSLKRFGMGGNITFEWNSNYTPAAEILPVKFDTALTAFQCNVNTGYRLTIQPHSSVSSIVFTGTDSSGLFILDSVYNITLKGSTAAGIPVVTLQNTGSCIELVNASACTVDGFILRSSNRSENRSTIKLYSTLLQPMTADTIRNNIISSFIPAILPVAHISSSTKDTCQMSQIVINKNQFLNVKDFAVIARKRAVNWTISENSFYATEPVFPDSSTASMILIDDHQYENYGDVHQVTGNIFGGSNAAAGGNMMQITTAGNYAFITVNKSARINNNIFNRIKLTCTNSSFISSNLPFISTERDGTNYPRPEAEPYTIAGNHVGSNQPGDSVVLVNTGSAENIFRIIYHNGGKEVKADSNNIRQVRVRDINTTGKAYFAAIAAGEESRVNSVSYNQLGDSIPMYGIQGTGVQRVLGITCRSAQIIGNRINNFRNTGSVEGIHNNGGTCSNNNICGLIRTKDPLNRTSNGYIGDVIGIGNLNGFTVNNNRIVHLLDSAAQTTPSTVAGILFYERSYGTAGGNFIDAVNYGPANPTLVRFTYGMTDAGSGAEVMAENNIIRLGVDSSGNTVSTNIFCCFASMWVATLRHNSFLLAGDSVSRSGFGSYIVFTSSFGTFANNIFAINRNFVAGATRQNIVYLAPVMNTYRFQAHHNIYWFDSTINKFENAHPTLWHFQQSDSIKDAFSFTGDPNFVSIAGTTGQLNLHLAAPSIAESRGSAVYNASNSTSLVDHDGESRANLSPVDIGADAGNYAIDSAVTCPADTIILFSNITGSNYQWKLDTGSGFVNINNNSIYSGANTSSLMVANSPTSFTGYQFRCESNTQISNIFRLAFVNKWTGAFNTAWENPANWSCGVVPDQNTDVTVDGFTVVLSSNTTIRSLKLLNGANLQIAPTFNLTIIQ